MGRTAWNLAVLVVLGSTAGCAAPAGHFGPAVPADLAPALAASEEELPAVEVRATRRREEDPVGPSGQPEWTTRRRFATSRVYVLPPWQVEAELWYRGRYENRETTAQRYQAELGVGLPGRLQLDYYQNFADAAGAGVVDTGPQVEARWAVADWGKIPFNPTLYGEYRWDYTGADKVEAKLLFGDVVAPRVHAAVNLIGEQETSGARATELGASAALSWTLIDRRLGIGAEFKTTRATESGSRDDPGWEHQAGPSLQWRITNHVHLDVVPMFGLNRDAHDVELFVVFGWDFGGGGDPGRLAPTSTKSR